MRKLLSLVLAFAMILGLFTFPVSADATTYQTVGQELAGLGVLKGVDAKGTLAEMQKLTREQALVVLTRLMGQEDKALATDAQPGFADVPATHWSAKYVAYAKLQGWTNGTSETQFGLGSDVTTKQVVTLMMRALGYTADWSKEDVVKKAQELGLLEGVSATPDDAIIRGELFIVMKNTLYTKPMGEKAELIYKLGLAENPIPATLEVVDVKAVNLKEVVVEFNQEVDKTTLEDAFSSVGLSLGKITQELQEDGKTVILTVERLMKNKEVYKVTISKVKSLSGLTLEKVTKEFKTQDNEVPKVEKIEVTGPRNFQIIFSEPIKTPGTVKLKLEGKTATGVAVKPTGSERKFDATTASNLVDGKTYTALVTGFTDYANYKNIDSEIEFEYAKVSDAPTVEVVKATQEYVVFKFNRPVKGLKLENFYHTYTAWKPVASYDSVEDMDKDTDKKNDVLDPTKARDEVVVRFIHTVDEFVKKSNNVWHPLQVGDVEVSVLGQVGSRKVVDNWGNQLQDSELKVTISADKEAPVVEAVEVTGEKELEITFSKKVLENRSNYEILNESGGKISGLAFTTSKEGKKIKINVGSPNLVGKTVILNVKDVRDDTINMNKMVGVESFNLTFGDKTFKGIKEAVLKYSPVKDTEYYANPTIYVAFSEAVDPESAMNIKNYLFTKDVNASEGDKSFFGVDADTSMFSDTVVQIVMSREVFEKKFLPLSKKTEAGKTHLFNLQVYVSSNLKDLAGNSYSAFTKFVDVKDASSAPTITDNEVKVTDYRTVEFSYDLPVITKGFEIDKDQFEIKVGSKKLEIDSVEFNGTKGIKISLKDEKNNDFRMSADVKNITVKYSPKLDKDKNPLEKAIQNELGTAAPGFVAKATGGTVKLVDRLAPAFVQGEVKDGDNVNKVIYKYVGGYDHEVKIYFNEEMDDQTFSIHTFKLTGVDGSEYMPSAWTLTEGNTLLTLKFKTSKKAVINTLRQELQASISDSASYVTTNFEGYKQNYYTYFQIQLQDHNSARDVAKNGFGSTDVYPVYHSKDVAQDFILKSADLDDLENALAMKLSIKEGAVDYTGKVYTATKTELSGGKTFTVSVDAAYTTPSFQWKLDDEVLGTANTQSVTKPGKLSVTVTAQKDGKTYTATGFVQVKYALKNLVLTAIPGVHEGLTTITSAPQTVTARYFVNEEVDVTADTPAREIMAKGENFLAAGLQDAKFNVGDVITVVEYENVANGTVISKGTVTLTKAMIKQFGAINAATFITPAPKADHKVIKLAGQVDDVIQIRNASKELGTVKLTATTGEYRLTSGQALVENDTLFVIVTRNGLTSSLEGQTPVTVGAADIALASAAVDAGNTKIDKDTGAFKQVAKDTFTLTLTNDKFLAAGELTLDKFEISAELTGDKEKLGTLKYKVSQVVSRDSDTQITVKVAPEGAPAGDMSAGTPLKLTFKVKESAIELGRDVTTTATTDLTVE